MKKIFRLTVLWLLCWAVVAPMAKGQTLGEVLRAVQNRQQLLKDRKASATALVSESDQDLNSPYASATIELIDWGSGLTSKPPDAAVDALSLSEKVRLLRKAWKEADRLTLEFIDARKLPTSTMRLEFEDREERITPENFSRMVTILARRVNCMKLLPWPLLWRQWGSSNTVYNLTALPDPPLDLPTAGPDPDTSPEDTIGTLGYSTFQLGGYLSYSRLHGGFLIEYPNPPGDPSGSYTSLALSPQIKGGGASSFAGRLQVFANSGYRINSITCESKLYDPASRAGADVQLEAGAAIQDLPSPPEVSGANNASAKCPGSWWVDIKPPNPDDTQNFDWYYVPVYPKQTSQSLLRDFAKFNTENGAGNDLDLHQTFCSAFLADFKLEFAALSNDSNAGPPEEAPPLQIVADTAYKQLKLRLGNDPANDCELIWTSSARNGLNVRGNGDWKAVYSGKSSDREPELVWQGGYDDTNNRWSEFGEYVADWWQPVLTQVVTGTYGVNITQPPAPERYKYKIDFYRKDQIGQKNQETGRYDFTGTPIETFTVENPSLTDDDISWLRITGSKAVYDRTDDETTWELIVTDQKSQTVVLDQTVTGDTVDTQMDDSVDLPTVQTVYEAGYEPGSAHPPRIHSVTETGEDGVRTTNYTYDKVNDENGHQVIANLKKIVQADGLQTRTDNFDSNELLTSSVNGPSQVSMGYSGSTVTRTESFGGAAVRTLSTTYTGDLLQATTTISGVPDAAHAVTQNDPTYRWLPKMTRGYDGTLSTFDYAWSDSVGTSDFIVTQQSGRGTGTTATTVAAGTRTITKISPAGKVFSTEVFDMGSGAELDFSTEQNHAPGTYYPYPTAFDCPLGTTKVLGYDAQGQVNSVTDRLGKATTYTFDALGRLTQAVRGAVTQDISYNPGHLGRFVTLWASGETDQTRDEQTTAFGAEQTLTIGGTEDITITRFETNAAITTSTENDTTAQNTQESVQKSTLAKTVTGNATEPWNISYIFPAGGWKTTTTHGTASALTASATYDALGRLTEEKSPSPSGSGTATTTYAYTAGQLASATDPIATTFYTYQPDGSLQKTSRGNRFVSVERATANPSEIDWECTNAAGEVLWQKNYYPLTSESKAGVTEYYPWGESARMVTTTPQISGDMLSVTSEGPNAKQTTSWKDGVPSGGSLISGAAQTGFSATANAFGQLTSQTVMPGQASANQQTVSLSPLGLPTGVSGAVNATIAHSFDASGHLTTLTRNGHWQTELVSPKGDALGSAGYGAPDAPVSAPAYGNAITKTLSTGAGNVQFTYNLAGLLQQRQFPDGSGESFGYDDNGALASHTTPRASFNFLPNVFGQPTQLGGMATLGYDLAGRVNDLNDAAGHHTISYADGQVDVETHASGPLAGQAVDHDYDDLGRLEWVRLPGNKAIHYIYNGPQGALSAVTTAGGTSGTWSDFDLVTGQAKTLALGSSFAVQRDFDGQGRVISHVSTAGGTTLAYARYYDADGHCYAANTPEGPWSYGYDAKGWLHTAQGWRSRTYNFDAVGRTVGANAIDYRPQTRLNASVIDLFGQVTPGASVSVNNAPVAVNPASGQFSQSFTAVPAGWKSFVVRGSLAGVGYHGSPAVAESVRDVFMPPASEGLGYDNSGNRNADARWSLAWNSLDQLTSIVEVTPLSPTGMMRLDFINDAQGRRVEKRVSVGGKLTRLTTTLWDGWRPVLEVDYAANGAEVDRRYYSWGPDESGSLAGAAGIGGLLEVLEIKGGVATRSLPIYDGHGNVVGLADGATGQRVATYQYGAFGEVLGVYGPRTSACPFRFQTKLYDEETGLSYFGKRYYDPKTQTWLSRDPLREAGGLNLYAYCQNDPVNGFDPVGLADVSIWDAALEFFYPGRYARKHRQENYEHMERNLMGNEMYAQQQKQIQFARLLGPSAYFNMKMVPVIDGTAQGSADEIANQANAQALAGYQQAREDYELNRWKFDLAVMAAGSAPSIVEGIGSRMLLAGASRNAALSEIEAFAGMPFGYQGGPGAMWIGEDLGSVTGKEFELVEYGDKLANFQNHHGVMDKWAAENIPDYVSRDPAGPSIRLSISAHDKTRKVFSVFTKEMTGKPIASLPWKDISPQEIKNLSERMFDAASVSPEAREEYYRAFNRYIYTGEW